MFHKCLHSSVHKVVETFTEIDDPSNYLMIEVHFMRIDRENINCAFLNLVMEKNSYNLNQNCSPIQTMHA